MGLLLDWGGLLGAKHTKLIGRDEKQAHLIVQVSLSSLNQNYILGFQSWMQISRFLQGRVLEVGSVLLQLA